MFFFVGKLQALCADVISELERLYEGPYPEVHADEGGNLEVSVTVVGQYIPPTIVKNRPELPLGKKASYTMRLSHVDKREPPAEYLARTIGEEFGLRQREATSIRQLGLVARRIR